MTSLKPRGSKGATLNQALLLLEADKVSETKGRLSCLPFGHSILAWQKAGATPIRNGLVELRSAKLKKARTPEGSEGACMDARPGLVGMDAD